MKTVYLRSEASLRKTARLGRLKRLADSYERVLEACASSIGDDSDYLAIFAPALADIERRRDAIASRIRKATEGGDS